MTHGFSTRLIGCKVLQDVAIACKHGCQLPQRRGLGYKAIFKSRYEELNHLGNFD